MTTVLAAERIHKSFGGVQAVRDVSLTVEEGRIVGLIGPNGSGKSTLLNVLAGVLKPTSGHVTLNGRRIDRMPPYRVVRLGVAKTHQIPQPFPAMTTRENVAVSVMYGSKRRPEAAGALEEADRLLGLVGLDEKADAQASSLTVQERKRLELGRVIATGARLLLLDEVFAGLSRDELKEAMDLFSQLQKELGFGALIVEHVMRAVLTLSDHIVVIVEGAKIAEGVPRQVVQEPAVVEAYLGTEAAHAPA